MKIGVDLDGVCYNFGEAYKSYLVRYQGFDESELTEPQTWDFFKEQWGMSTEDFLKYFAMGVNFGYIFRIGEPMPGAVDGVRALQDAGHTIHIVTHRDVGDHCAANTEHWLKSVGIKYDTLTFSRDKTIVPVDVFIEDNVDNHEALLNEGVAAFLIDRPWNAHVDVGEKYGFAGLRVSCWDEFVDAVERIESVV